MSEVIGLVARRRARTGDGEAKSVRVIGKETLEYGRFSGTRGTRYNDWTVDVGGFQIKRFSPEELCCLVLQSMESYLKGPLWSREASKKGLFAVSILCTVIRSELVQLCTKAFGKLIGRRHTNNNQLTFSGSCTR